jgi:hypothetical protein
MLRQAGADLLRKDGLDFNEEGHSPVSKFGDLSNESNRVRLVKAMIMNKAFPGFDFDSYRLERAVAKLPRRTMHEVVSTMADVFEIDRQKTSFLLDGFKRRYVTNGAL